MRVINLASGSDGNCTYLETEESKIILDMGLSSSETIKRLKLIGIDPEEIDAIVISHEHSDHIKGVDVFANKFHTNVFAHQDVWSGLDNKFRKIQLCQRKIFDNTFSFKDLTITPVEVPHDVKCFGFSFSKADKKISVITDLGHINDKILNSIRGSQIVYLESNYDRNMLLNGTKYPLSLKRRIDGPNGHLSNKVSSDVAEFLTNTGTRQIILSHLSKENNTPQLAYETMCNHLKENDIIEGQDVRIDVASHNIGAFFRLK